jgi:heptosyltransferase-1
VKAGHYDAVIDAQGLLKSSFITRLANGPKFGLDKQSAREPLSARVLDCPQAVPWGQHAILRLRQLFAQSLGYTLPNGAVDYGLARQQRTRSFGRDSQLIFFHGTTWASKHWPEDYWRELVTLATADGCRVLLPWGNDEEKSRAERLAQGHEGASVLPHLSLSALFDLLLTLDGFVAVDTGLAHLAAAAGLAGVALYGPTDPALTGVIGVRAKSLAVEFPCAPCRRADCHYNGNEGSGIFPACFSSLPPEWVWQQLQMVSHSGAL